MTNEERILERLERMEEQIAFLHERAQGTKELIQDLTPISNHAFRLMVSELQDVHGHVHLDDVFELLRRGLRGVPNLNYCLDQLENLIDLWRTIHPAIAPTWPHIIATMGEWHRDGVFDKLGALKGVGGKMLDTTTPDDIARVARAGCAVVTCPRSNHHLECGTFDWPAFAAAGVEVALGTDSVASGETLNVREEVTFARQLYPGLDPRVLVRAAVKGGQRVVGGRTPFLRRGETWQEGFRWELSRDL